MTRVFLLQGAHLVVVNIFVPICAQTHYTAQDKVMFVILNFNVISPPQIGLVLNKTIVFLGLFKTGKKSIA